MSVEELHRTLQRCQRKLEADVKRFTKQPGQPGPPRTPQTPRRSPVTTPPTPAPEDLIKPQCPMPARLGAPPPSSSSGVWKSWATPPAVAERQSTPSPPEMLDRLVAPGAALSLVMEESTEVTLGDTTILSQASHQGDAVNVRPGARGSVTNVCRAPFSDVTNTIGTTTPQAMKKVDSIKDDEDISTEDQAVGGGLGWEPLESLDGSSISALSPRGTSCPSVCSLGLWEPSPISECSRPLVTRMSSMPMSDISTPPPRDNLYLTRLDSTCGESYAEQSSHSVHLNMSPLVSRHQGSSLPPTPNTGCSRQSSGPTRSRAGLQTSSTRRCFEWTSPGLSVSQSSLVSSLLSVSVASSPKDTRGRAQNGSFEDVPLLFLPEESQVLQEPTGLDGCDASSSVGAKDTTLPTMLQGTEEWQCSRTEDATPADAGEDVVEGSQCRDSEDVRPPDVCDGFARRWQSSGDSGATPADASDHLGDPWHCSGDSGATPANGSGGLTGWRYGDAPDPTLADRSGDDADATRADAGDDLADRSLPTQNLHLPAELSVSCVTASAVADESLGHIMPPEVPLTIPAGGTTRAASAGLERRGQGRSLRSRKPQPGCFSCWAW